MTTSFRAPDIECGGCAAAIRKALGRADGVSDVTVDIDNKTVVVTHEASAEEVAALLDRAGFPATVKG